MNKPKYSSNFVNLCQKSLSNTSTCGNISTNLSTLKSKKTSKLSKQYRCDEHKWTNTTNLEVISTKQITNQLRIKELQIYLNSLISQRIQSSRLRNMRSFKYGITVKYVKNLGVMCQDDKNKWIYVYYFQIIEL